MFNIYLTSHGSFKNVFAYFNFLRNKDYLKRAQYYAQQGVDALRAATPKDSGKTADCWRYEIVYGVTDTEISWINDNITYQGDPIVILLQYGHGTGTGGYVKGYDFINPAIKPVFDDILSGVEQAVRSF